MIRVRCLPMRGETSKGAYVPIADRSGGRAESNAGGHLTAAPINSLQWQDKHAAPESMCDSGRSQWPWSSSD